MGGLRVFFILLLFILIGVLIYYGYRIKNMKMPSQGSNACQNHGLWTDGCKVPQEISLDSSIVTPFGKRLRVVSFTTDPSFPSKPYNAYMWYRFRYVNTSTGGYGGYSDWTLTPIYSGSCCLDCVGSDTPGVCETNTKIGSDGCKANHLTLGILASDLDYATLTTPNMWAVVHSYLSKTPSPPPSNAPDNPIGFLVPGTTINGESYYQFLDTSDPCGSGTCKPFGLCANQPTPGSNGCTSDACE